jgi:hypothetical protein
MKTLLLSIIVISIFAGCSSKEIDDGARGIINDISDAFERGKDKSAN